MNADTVIDEPGTSAIMAVRTGSPLGLDAASHGATLPFMNCYLIAGTDLTATDVLHAYPDAYEVGSGVWVAPSKEETCADVAERLGMNSTIQNTGIVVSVGAYYGYYNNALWEKINAWKAR